jgi:rSAM/selenodomain-associated transferase 1
MTGALVVFAREPLAGEVKTRLAEHVGDATAAHVYAQLLSRTLRLVERSHFTARYLFAADATQIQYFEDRLNLDHWQVCAQSRGDIGQRMHHAIDAVFVEHEFVVLIGSDVADGEVADLDTARKVLSGRLNSAVVGPSADGGYWLIGLREPQAILFQDLAWSTDTVFAETMLRMANIGLAVQCLTPRHDVDVPDDLRYLP